MKKKIDWKSTSVLERNKVVAARVLKWKEVKKPWLLRSGVFWVGDSGVMAVKSPQHMEPFSPTTDNNDAAIVLDRCESAVCYKHTGGTYAVELKIGRYRGYGESCQSLAEAVCLAALGACGVDVLI